MNGIADLFKLSDVTPGKPSPMMLFPIGDWTSDKYPKLTLSQELADEVIANFEADVLRTKVPVDLNHDPKSPANGWVDRLYMAPYEWKGLSGEALYADWTPNELGAEYVNKDEFAYDSIDLADYYTDPATGAQYDNVLKAVSLANRPVLRMMPGVKDAGDALRLAEPRTFQLSEFTLADSAAEPDPVAELCDKVDALLAELSTTLKGKAGIPDIRTMMRAVKAKASAHTLADAGSFDDLREEIADAIEALIPGDVEVWIRDFGPDWAVYGVYGEPGDDDLYRVDVTQNADGTFTFGPPIEVEAETTYVPVDDGNPEGSTDASSTALSHPAKATEGQPVVLAEGDAAKEGADRMKSVALKLNLAEDADEATVLAEVTKLEERVTVAETKLAEDAQAKHDAEIESSLTQLSEAGNLTSAEREKWLAEPDLLAGRIDARKGMKPNSIVDLTEHGTHEGSSADGVDLAEDLSRRAIALSEEKGIDLAEAMSIEIMNTPGIAEARLAELATRMHD